MGVAAAVGIGGAILGNRSSKKAASKARKRGTAAERRAQEAQLEAEQRAFDRATAAEERARLDLAPFREFGEGQIGATEDILTSQGQFDFLANNPLFDAALNNVNERTNAGAAARGRFSAGDTAEELFNNYLGTAFPLLQSQTNNLFRAVETGGNAAARTGNAALETGRIGSQAAFGTGQGIASSEQSIGNLGAAEAIAAGNANTGLIGSVTGLLPGILGGIKSRFGGPPDLTTVGGLMPNPPPGG